MSDAPYVKKILIAVIIFNSITITNAPLISDAPNVKKIPYDFSNHITNVRCISDALYCIKKIPYCSSHIQTTCT